MGNPSDLLTASEVADMLRTTPKTVHEWAKAGKIHRIELPGARSSRFRRSEVEAILDGSHVPEDVA